MTKPWLMPAVYIWGQIIHKIQGMTEMIQGTFVQEIADIINNVTRVPPDQRITIYQADELATKYGELLVTHFQDTKTMWDFFRASLRQYHIRQLSKVGKEKEAWKKACCVGRNRSRGDATRQMSTSQSCSNRTRF